VINGNATQMQISQAFGVPLVTVKRYVKLYRQGGVRAFFCTAKAACWPQTEVCQQAQRLLNEGMEVPEVGPTGGDYGQHSAQGDPGRATDS
jgi:hypothetical protein